MRLFAGRKAAKKRGVGGLTGWIVGSDGSAMQVPGYTRLIDCPEVAAAVDAIAGSVSSMTIHLMENTKAGDVRVRDALATKVDINPYGPTTRKTWVEWIVRTMLTTGDGNAFVLPVTTNGYLDDLMLCRMQPRSRSATATSCSGAGAVLRRTRCCTLCSTRT